MYKRQALGSLVSDLSLNKIKSINSEYEEVNELLKNENYKEFSNKIKEMKDAQEEFRKKEIVKINDKYEREKKSEFYKFISILIHNKLSEYNEKKLEYEYDKKELIEEINSINIKTSNIIKKSSIGLIIIVAIIFIIYKNSTTSNWQINLIDIMFFLIPILFTGIFNIKLFKVSEKISERINRNRQEKICLLYTSPSPRDCS